MTRENIFKEIDAERNHQDEKFGGAETDDHMNGCMEWAGYISKYSMNWFNGGFPPYDNKGFRTSMVKVASLAIAAIEQIDRKQ